MRTIGIPELDEKDAIKTTRKSRSFNSGLAPNCFWVFHVIMTQTLPFADPQFMAVYQEFERAAYAAAWEREIVVAFRRHNCNNPAR